MIWETAKTQILEKVITNNDADILLVKLGDEIIAKNSNEASYPLALSIDNITWENIVDFGTVANSTSNNFVTGGNNINTSKATNGTKLLPIIKGSDNADLSVSNGNSAAVQIKYKDGFNDKIKLGEKKFTDFHIGNDGKATAKLEGTDGLKVKVDQAKLNTELNKLDSEISVENKLYNTKIPMKYQIKGLQYMAAMGNVIYTLNLDSNIKPYVGMGVGIAKLTIKGFSNNAESLQPAIQGKFGFSFNMGRFIPYIGYRGLYISEGESYSAMNSVREQKEGSWYAAGAVKNECKNATNLADGSFGTSCASSKVEGGSYPLGNYTKNITTSALLNNLEVGVKIPLGI